MRSCLFLVFLLRQPVPRPSILRRLQHRPDVFHRTVHGLFDHPRCKYVPDRTELDIFQSKSVQQPCKAMLLHLDRAEHRNSNMLFADTSARKMCIAMCTIRLTRLQLVRLPAKQLGSQLRDPLANLFRRVAIGIIVCLQRSALDLMLDLCLCLAQSMPYVCLRDQLIEKIVLDCKAHIQFVFCSGVG